jgi:hypothetical protein
MSRLIWSTCLASLASLGFAGAAQAFTVVTPPATDTAFEDLLRSGELQEVYVPGGRAGNNSLNTAERELEILDPLEVDFKNGYPGTIIPNSQGPLNGATGQFVWGNGTANPFTLVYTPQATTKLTFNVGGINGQGGTTLTTNEAIGQVTEIFLRTRVASQNSAGTFTTNLTDLMLNGTSVGQTLTSSCTRVGTANCSDVDYLRIQGVNGGFTLTGKAAFNWSAGTIPEKSRMMFQVKMAGPGSRPVPAPGMMGGMALAGAGTLWKKLKGK